MGSLGRVRGPTVDGIHPALPIIRKEGLGLRDYRNCIGFGSGVLGGFAGFLLLLLQFDFWIWGAAGGFCFLLLLFGWAGLGCRWVVFAHVEGKFETIEEAVQFEAKFTQFLFILLLRV